MIAINKIYGRLKMKHFKMPNAPYSNRCVLFKQITGNQNYNILNAKI